MTTSGKTRFFIFILIFSYSSLVLSGDDKGIALYYFRQAEVLYDSGKIKEAEKLLRNSYEFYPDFSETTFLLSLILFKEQNTTLTGLSFLKQALNDRSWVKTDPFIAERELGRVYLQIGLLKEALEVFRNMGIKLKEDMYSALLMVKTLKESNSLKLEEFLTDSLKRFPSYDEFYILYAEYLEKKGKRDMAIRIINQGLEKLPDNPDLILTKIKLSILDISTEKTKEETTLKNDNRGSTLLNTPQYSLRHDSNLQGTSQLLDKYFEKGGRSPLASILAVSLEMEEPEHYIDLFFTYDGNKDILFLDQFVLLLKEKEELFTLFKEKESGYSGERVMDKNRDGFYEELYTYNNGSLTLWQRDKNQDGFIEMEIVFKEDMPVKIGFFIITGNAVYGKYSTYPYLESLTYEKNAIKKEFLLLPLDYAYPLFRETEKEDQTGLALSVRDTFIPPGEKAISSRAFRINEYRNGYLSSVSEFLSGEYVSLSRDTDGDGHMDHIIDYSNGIPHKGKQDLDGDGYYEIMEYYKDGWLAKITYDYNNDDRPDCIQFFNKAGENLETHWDYNSDGIIDAKEIMEKNGKTNFSFSTGYDGKFDLFIVFQGGRVVSSRRGKKELTIIPGTKPGLYWIGKRGKDVDVTLLSESGLYYSKGIMYFVFRYRDSIYIEECSTVVEPR
ncbi:MAG: tetratricopeptide repeat protein [Spirochaetales bacterium]|nr:tetratricopeptide repeat protein [Spirochaetales bacterium]